jgi:hypothetical protein
VSLSLSLSLSPPVAGAVPFCPFERAAPAPSVLTGAAPCASPAEGCAAERARPTAACAFRASSL